MIALKNYFKDTEILNAQKDKALWQIEKLKK